MDWMLYYLLSKQRNIPQDFNGDVLNEILIEKRPRVILNKYAFIPQKKKRRGHV